MLSSGLEYHLEYRTRGMSVEMIVSGLEEGMLIACVLVNRVRYFYKMGATDVLQSKPIKQLD